MAVAKMCTNKITREARSENEGEEGMKGDVCMRWPPMKELSVELVQLGQLVWPIVITSFLLYFRAVISMLFLGHLGDSELAGGSLAIAFANITGYSILKGLSMGMEPICGQAFGAKKWAVLNLTFRKTLLLLLLVTVPVSFLWLNLKSVFVYLGQDPEILSIAQEYIIFSLPDLMGQAWLHPLRIFLRTQGITKPLTISATIAVLIHIPINYFIVSYLGLGVRGVALAASWNTISINLGLLAYLLFSSKSLKPWAGGASFDCLRGWGPLIALALPSCASVCLEWWWYEVILILCGILPDPQSTVAATGILIQTTGLLYVIPHSLSMGLSTRIGHGLGAYQPAQAQKATYVGLAVAAACGLSAFLFTLAVRETWGEMFTDDPKILALTSAVLPIIGFCEIGNCPQTAGCGVLRGTARPSLGAKINFAAFYVIGLPAAAFAAFKLKLGFLGLWLGLVAAQASCVGMMLYTVFCTDWRVQAEKAEELTGMSPGPKEDLEARLVG